MPREKPNLRAASRVARRSAGEVLNLSVGGIGVLAAAALHSWPVLALAGAAYGAMIAWDVATPSYWRGTRDEAPPLELPELPPLPEPSTLFPPAREAVHQLQSAHEALAQVLSTASSSVRGYAAVILANLQETEAHAVVLIERLEQLATYLAGAEQRPVRRSHEQLRQRAAEAEDPDAQADYREAARAQEEHLETLAELRRAQERVQANLSRVLATLEGLGPKLMQMQVLGEQEMDTLSGSIHRELDRMNAEVSAFEETLQTLPLQGARA